MQARKYYKLTSQNLYALKHWMVHEMQICYRSQSHAVTIDGSTIRIFVRNGITLHWRHHRGNSVQIYQPHLTVYIGAYQRKHQSSASLAFMQGIHRWPVNSPHNGPVTRKMFPFDDVIMKLQNKCIHAVHIERLFSIYMFKHYDKIDIYSQLMAFESQRPEHITMALTCKTYHISVYLGKQ